MHKEIKVIFIIGLSLACVLSLSPNIFARDYADYTGEGVYNPSPTNSSDWPTTCQGIANGVSQRISPEIGQWINENICRIPKEQPFLQPSSSVCSNIDFNQEILPGKGIPQKIYCQDIFPTSVWSYPDTSVRLVFMYPNGEVYEALFIPYDNGSRFSPSFLFNHNSAEFVQGLPINDLHLVSNPSSRPDFQFPAQLPICQKVASEKICGIPKEQPQVQIISPIVYDGNSIQLALNSTAREMGLDKQYNFGDIVFDYQGKIDRGGLNLRDDRGRTCSLPAGTWMSNGHTADIPTMYFTAYSTPGLLDTQCIFVFSEIQSGVYRQYVFPKELLLQAQPPVLTPTPVGPTSMPRLNIEPEQVKIKPIY